jgi:protein-S-isoprenylcysteine O-methyltransferase Ste14
MTEMLFNPYFWLGLALIFNISHMLFHVAFFYGYKGKHSLIYDGILGYLGALFILILVYIDRDTVQVSKATAIPIGITLFILGIIIHLKAQFDFNRYSENKSKTSIRTIFLIDKGIYKYLKHPMYLGGSIFYIGASLAALSLVGLASVWIWILLIAICGYLEEVELRTNLPEGQYENYSKKTWA